MHVSLLIDIKHTATNFNRYFSHVLYVTNTSNLLIHFTCILCYGQLKFFREEKCQSIVELMTANVVAVGIEHIYYYNLFNMHM